MHGVTAHNPLTRSWLLLASGAIGLSALFAVLLVVARTPLLQQWFGGADLFHTVLVLHVNFSVLIWLLAFGVVLWSLALYRMHPLLDPLAFGLVIVGALLITLSPLLTPPPQPVMSNYIPILHSPAFLTGLCAFAAGIGLYALRRLAAPVAGEGGESGARSGWLAALGLLLALLLFAVTAWRLGQPLDSPSAFELLFWGGGHLLQFVYLLLLISGWQMLLGRGFSPLVERLLGTLVLLLFATALGLALLLAPDSAAYREGFTRLMRYGTPLLALPAVILLWSPREIPGLRLSQLMLLAGLLLGLLINGDNVSVTAHYHATNAAITLAFMTLAYRLFARLGLGEVAGGWAGRQLRLYFAGMVIYIGGMALSGQFDVPRKVAMATEGQQALAMGLMGLGGLVAIAATLLFVALQLLAMIRHHPSPARHGEQHETPS